MHNRILVFMLVSVFSGSASALTSICSSEFLPFSGQNTLRHEASWSYHDNWFYNLFVEVRTEVEGPDSPALVDQLEMSTGGVALHFLDNPADGQYALRGSVQVGYPLAWGFDGYYGIECPTWMGEIANNAEDLDASEPTRLIGFSNGAVSVSAAEPGSCAGNGACPGDVVRTPVDSASEVALYPRFVEPEKFPPQSTQGTLEAIGGNSLVIRTRVGGFAQYTISPDAPIKRVQDVNESELKRDDRVGVYWASRNPNDEQAIVVRIYRSQPRGFSRSPSVSVPADNPGLELRSVVDSIERGQGDQVRLVLAQGNTTVQIPRNAPIKLIESLTAAQLQSLVGQKVQVQSQPTENGLPIVRAIDILQ